MARMPSPAAYREKIWRTTSASLAWTTIRQPCPSPIRCVRYPNGTAPAAIFRSTRPRSPRWVFARIFRRSSAEITPPICEARDESGWPAITS
jgi:hypothetical protein